MPALQMIYIVVFDYISICIHEHLCILVHVRIHVNIRMHTRACVDKWITAGARARMRT